MHSHINKKININLRIQTYYNNIKCDNNNLNNFTSYGLKCKIIVRIIHRFFKLAFDVFISYA